VVALSGSPYKRTVLFVYDTFEQWYDCCNLFQRCTDPDWLHHKIFLREKKALRAIGVLLRRKLGNDFCFVDMTVEEDLRGDVIPRFDVAVLLLHDWPTVNENPGWLVKFTNFLQMSLAVPGFVQVTCQRGDAVMGFVLA
jgi:hypothetical protein